MKKRILSAVVAVAMVFSTVACFTSCGGKKEYPVKIGDVSVGKEPKNIVILDKNLTDIVSCIGYDIKLVGRSEAVNQQGIEVVPVVGSETDPSVKKITELEADLVISDKSLDDSIRRKIIDSGVQVVQFDTAPTKTQLENLYGNIGRVLGGNITGLEKAEKAYDDFVETLDNIRYAAQADSVVKTVCYLYIENGVLKTMNGASWGGVMLEGTGGINVSEHAETDVVNNDELLLSNPDYIFCSTQEVVDYLNNSDTLYTLNALDENTFIVPYEDITMQGYTALDVLETMLKNMYPEQFNQEETVDQTVDEY